MLLFYLNKLQSSICKKVFFVNRTMLTVFVWLIFSIFLIGFFSPESSLVERAIAIVLLLVSPFIIRALIDFCFKLFGKNESVSNSDKKGYVVYSEYIKSPEWEVKKNSKLENAGWKCEVCGKRASEVHHFTHKTLGRETMTDLIAVCTECHEKLENEKLEERKKELLKRVTT